MTTMAVGLGLAGCGDDGDAATAAPGTVEERLAEAREAVAEARAEQPEASVNPCEVLTEATIRANVTVPEGAEITQRRGSGHATKLCTYTWEDPDFDREAHTRELMKRMAERMRKGGTAEGILEAAAGARAGGEVSITHEPSAEDEESARRMFDGAMERLNRGASHEVEAGGKTTKVTFQFSTEPVTGVGDQAHWSPRMQQLSVRNGATIFHLVVKVEDEPAQNLELAKAIARAIIGA